MDNNVFTVKNLSFAYGKQQVLKNLDLELHEGKITTLIGANGCGKSTLFNLMTKTSVRTRARSFCGAEISLGCGSKTLPKKSLSSTSTTRRRWI